MFQDARDEDLSDLLGVHISTIWLLIVVRDFLFYGKSWVFISPSPGKKGVQLFVEEAMPRAPWVSGNTYNV